MEPALTATRLDRLVMPPSRYRELMMNDLMRLTDSEYQAGWHFCFEWDGLLVGPGMPEMDVCDCPHRMKPAA